MAERAKRKKKEAPPNPGKGLIPAIRKKIANIVMLPNCRNGSEGRNASQFRNGYEFQLPEGD